MMKTDGGAITVFQLMMAFLFVAVSVVAGQKETVLDSRGEPVKVNAPYYINSLMENRLMSISRYRMNTFGPISCPGRVLMINSLLPPKLLPVIFVLSSDVVRVSTELNIKFTRPSICPESGFWRVKDSSSPTKDIHLTGSESSKDSTFTILKNSDGSYKLAFGSADQPTDIGLEGIGPGEARLILSNYSSFPVLFVPA